MNSAENLMVFFGFVTLLNYVSFTDYQIDWIIITLELVPLLLFLLFSVISIVKSLEKEDKKKRKNKNE